MYPFRTFLTVLILISSLIFTACPSTQSLEKAKGASSKLATYANTGVNITRELFQAGILPLETKDKVADAFIVLAKAGQQFDAAVISLQTQFGNTPPKNELQALYALFSSTVITNFLNVLQILKLVNDTAKYQAIIETIRTGILIIANVFGHKATVRARLATV